ncbi:MAG: sulfatase-like hydrolase/transferase [Candidatus Nanopelagicales bacterium]
MDVTRRGLLAAGLGAGVALGASACASPSTGGRPIPAPAPVRARPGAPNLLIVFSDDHRADHLGVTGAVPFLQTPVLDSLASDGVRFDNAYVTTALCSPSRATLLTGQYASRHGVQNNLSAWTPGTPSFFDSLAAAGYRCAYIGKWHMPGDLPDLPGVERFVTFTIEEGQGVYRDCPLIVDGVETPRPGTYVSTDLTDLALTWLDDGDDRPYCLVVAHKAVHHEFEPPDDLLGLYDDVEIDLPDEAFTYQTLLDRNVWEGTAGRLQTSYRRYCETLLGLDREIGRLAARDADNTVLIYTSDNGYSWGEHVLTGKRWAYDDNIKVPLIVRWPKGVASPGTVIEEPVLNIDIAPTLLDIAGVPIPATMQGRSFAPLLRGDAVDWREDVFYEYFADFPYQVPPSQAVRTDRWLYVEYDRGLPPELYDTVSDPAQRANLIEDPAHAVTRQELSQRLAELRREFT